MSDDAATTGEWDFYPCKVDDAPASIFLDMRYGRGGPPAGADTLYWLAIEMIHSDEHGMGSNVELEALIPVEDRMIASASSLGLAYVGRLRNNGRWQLTFYGPAGLEKALKRISTAEDLGGRPADVGTQPDREWSYYRDFLYPNAERRQWMKDRALTHVLAEHGDRAETSRRVDHWIYFASPEKRDAFVVAARAEGFVVEARDDADHADQPLGAQLYRTDTVELPHIHDVVMLLVRLAAEHDGDYDGWETSVETGAA
jgi:hypothetical protein